MNYHDRNDIEFIKSFVRYDPESGKLYWLPRDNDKAFNSCRAHKEAFSTLNNQGYLKGSIHTNYYLAHRMAYALHYGVWPDKIDHINGVKTDNRIVNLRSVDYKTNAKNRALSKNNKSGFVGVSKTSCGQKWKATISDNGKHTCLGTFNTMSEAIEVRSEAERKLDFHPNHGRTKDEANQAEDYWSIAKKAAAEEAAAWRKWQKARKQAEEAWAIYQGSISK